jgi:hypothetical protein
MWAWLLSLAGLARRALGWAVASRPSPAIRLGGITPQPDPQPTIAAKDVTGLDFWRSSAHHDGGNTPGRLPLLDEWAVRRSETPRERGSSAGHGWSWTAPNSDEPSSIQCTLRNPRPPWIPPASSDPRHNPRSHPSPRHPPRDPTRRHRRRRSRPTDPPLFRPPLRARRTRNPRPHTPRPGNPRLPHSRPPHSRPPDTPPPHTPPPHRRPPHRRPRRGWPKRRSAGRGWPGHGGPPHGMRATGKGQ